MPNAITKGRFLADLTKLVNPASFTAQPKTSLLPERWHGGPNYLNERKDIQAGANEGG